MRGLGIVAIALGITGCDRVLGLDERDWLDGYSYRKQISVTPGVGRDLVEFPVSIALTDPDLAAHARTDGRDLVFTSATNEVLPYEIVDYDAATGSLEAWVRVPVVSATDVTEVRFYYGGLLMPTIETSTWEADLEAVWHLSASGAESDSSSHRHGLAAPPTLERVPGIVGPAYAFNGTQAVTSPDPTKSFDFGMESFSISIWVRVTGSLGMYDIPLYKGGTSMFERGYSFLLGSGEWRFTIGDGAQDQSSSFGVEANMIGNWVPLVAVVDRSVPELRTYSNGAFISALPITGGSLDSSYDLAFGGPLVFPFTGQIDETRIYRRALSADWIRAEYLNLSRRDTFLSIADEEQH